jgi:hypothetical protein
MAQRMVSPGVFTQEKDLSFLPQGIAEIGAAFIGPTLKGPAFRPVIVSSQEEFTAIYGDTTPDFYTPYAVQNYLREAGRATVCRVLGLDGYDNGTTESLILAITSASVTANVGVLFPSRRGVTLPTGSVSGTPTNFSLTISGTNGSNTYTSMSVDPTSTRYFLKVLGDSPKSSKDAFVSLQFPGGAGFCSGALAGSGSMSLLIESTQLMLSGSIYGTYREATTPWIRSQVIGAQRFNLFKFHTLADGTTANTNVKISISSIKPPTISGKYGTFSVLVRSFDDTDASVNVLEQFDNLNLDPTDANYIARRIGTARTVIDANNDIYLEGDYPNNSRYVYAEMDDAIDNLPTDALPYGFAPLAAPINPINILAAPSYITTRYAIPTGATTAVSNNKIYYGFDFSNTTGLSYLSPIPSGSRDAANSTLKVGVFPTGSSYVPAGGADPGFDLNVNLAATDLVDIAPANAQAYRKFSVPFQNGFDGQNPASTLAVGGTLSTTNTQGFDLSDSTKSGARAYKRCIDALANPDAWDINMLVLPGVIYSLHSYIAAEGIKMCENRADCFYIMDATTLGATVATAVSDISGLDTSYAAVYYPWIKVRDNGTNQTLWAPPSVVMPNVYAFNDRVGAEWFAPAGLQRGSIDVALQVRTRTDQSNRDTLYEGRVNPIATFPGQGIVTWGQKTLQVDASALDRINVRRLLIAVKKFIASTSRYLVFEQNVESTRQRFLSIVNPYLQSVQERAGLYAFKVVMDETNNTPDLIDRNVLVGDLFLQPTRTAEFISLTFNILPTGTSFSE